MATPPKQIDFITPKVFMKLTGKSRTTTWRILTSIKDALQIKERDLTRQELSEYWNLDLKSQ